ncbi:olfactory receptor 10A7-like [Tachyglossus aculeatus]|uniref:olfactory receptor 10A7-like n=1 Tax=Tachyglossus aculeatus TaxID=9261 RepID=UPI0018F4E174|nr:olfactory receptor 10A7-like [Tachyglossus aculeatus]
MARYDLSQFNPEPEGPKEAMAQGNQTTVTEFILLGFSHLPQLKPLLFVLFLVMFLITLAGNSLIIFVTVTSSALHTPMYFFLRNLSLLEICYSLDIVPRLLVDLLADRRRISLLACALQLLLILSCGIAECFLLTVMAFDRYVAICHPLRYGAFMDPRRCLRVAVGTWMVGVSVSFTFTLWLFSFPFCGRQEVHHFLCDISPLLSLVCADTGVFEAHVLATTIFVTLVPFTLIAVSYGCILSAVLGSRLVSGRSRALSTCMSHLLVVTLFYGTTGVIHLQPRSSYSPETKELVSLSYTVVTPMLNPIIYSLRNEEVRSGASSQGAQLEFCLASLPCCGSLAASRLDSHQVDWDLLPRGLS